MAFNATDIFGNILEVGGDLFSSAFGKEKDDDKELPIPDKKEEIIITTPTDNNYEVQPGDNLYKIAKANNTTLEELMITNSQITDPNKISIGQKIILPGENQEPKKELLKSEESKNKVESYQVIAGDTINQISSRTGVSIDEILKANPDIKDINKINKGQTIKLIHKGPVNEEKKDIVEDVVEGKKEDRFKSETDVDQPLTYGMSTRDKLDNLYGKLQNDPKKKERFKDQFVDKLNGYLDGYLGKNTGTDIIDYSKGQGTKDTIDIIFNKGNPENPFGHVTIRIGEKLYQMDGTKY